MKQTNKKKLGLQSSHWSITVRELVIKRIQDCAAGEPVIEDFNGDEHVVAELDLMSDEDLLILFEELIGFNG
jgi:hypothetical protein